jgi:predicted amino acid racemase
MIEKPMVPTGKVGKNLTGESPEYDDADRDKTSVRAIIDLGVLDIDIKQVYPFDKGIEILGASSDMMILNITDDTNLKVGDEINFGVNYLAVLRAMNSDYVDKKVVNTRKTKNKPEKAEI